MIIRTEEEVDDIISKMVSRWFYSAPILYKTVCKNPVSKNKNMECAARCGKNRIEYNPDLLLESSSGEIKNLICLEISRILLGHCSKRRPEPFDPEIAIEASNLAILQNPLGDFPPNESFEFYYKALMEKDEDDEDENKEKNEGGFSCGFCDESGKESAMDATELWNDGDLFEELQKEDEILNDLCDEKAVIQSLGMLPGNMAGSLKKRLKINKTKVKDKIKVAKIFMASAAGGNKRVSTRSKPNRRTGFVHMGSKRGKDKTRLFCVIDVSASVSDSMIERYVNYVNYIYRKYKPQIDLIEADRKLKMETLMRVKSTIRKFHVVGRGGTDFQCVFDYLAALKGRKKYDGVILFTDGQVRRPVIPKELNIRVLWAVDYKNDFFEKNFKDEKFVTYLG